MFVTSDPGGPERLSPMLVVPDAEQGSLPPHPNGGSWKYFATSMTDDLMLSLFRQEAEEHLRTRGFFIFGSAAA